MISDVLRVRMLAAMGLPAVAALAGACREADHPVTPTDVVVARVDGGEVDSTGKNATSEPMESMEPRTCTRDAVLEHVCGLTADARSGDVSIARCGDDATSVVTKDEASSLTHGDAFYQHDPGADALKRDDGLTATKRRRSKGHSGNLCCYSSCAAANVSAEGPPIPSGARTQVRCTPLFRAGTSAPAASDSLCAAAIDFGDGSGTAEFVARQGETCCYRAFSPPPLIMRGRPLREAGLPVLAPPRAATGGWTDNLDVDLDAGDVDAETRAELARAFATDGALEHASVAAFARLALDLMVLGAPADLVDRAHVAARDEIRHARVAYALASSFAGQAIGPGPLPIAATSRDAGLLAIIDETFIDGCVGETVAALELGEASARARPPLAAALETMASDEASHAELAWRIVAWGLEVGGDDVARLLRTRLADLAEELSAPPARPSAAGSDLSAYGVLDDSTRRAIRRRALTDVALPCTRSLLCASRTRPV